MFPISLELLPANFDTEIKTDVEELTRSILKDVVRLAPDEMRNLMTDNPPSLRGNAPAKVTRELFDSIEGDEQNLEISMAGHALFLDPIFEGLPSGGYLNRPFIERGIARALDQIV